MKDRGGMRQLDFVDKNDLLIDRYHMGRMRLKEFFVRDQFSEESHPLGQTKVYFWQHKKEDGCTVKVEATTTNSNEKAHQVMDMFMSQLVHPNAFKMITEELEKSRWFSNTEIEKVHFVKSGDTDIGAIFVWGNIFFHIQSSGEHEHSISEFVDGLEEHWVDMKPNEDHSADFEVVVEKTELEPGEEITVSRVGPRNEHKYSSFIFVAGPKRLIRIYRDKGQFKLKLKDTDVKTYFEPGVMIIAVQPDGKFVRSKRITFTVKK